MTRLMVLALVLPLVFSLFVVAAHQAAAPQPNLATAHLLTDSVESLGARCLDGSPQRYWLQKATPGSVNATKWSFHIMGGAWCESESACLERAYKADCYLGSSNISCFNNAGARVPGVTFNTTMDFLKIPSCNGARWCGGLMMNDPDRNPVTHDWNKVLIPYCDGGSFSGNNDTVVRAMYDGVERDLYYRGFRNLQAVIGDLSNVAGLEEATMLILSGDSAGGLATYYHADFFQESLPNTKVYAAPDSGYFYSEPSYRQWIDGLGWVVSAMNSTQGLNQNCVKKYTDMDKDPLLCAFPQNVAPYIKTPLFVMNSRFDPALDSISAGVKSDDTAAVQAVGDLLLQHVKQTVLNRPGNAAFLTSCHEHCGQWSQSAYDGGFNVTIDGTTAPEAVNEWLLGRNRTLWVQEASYPCNDCCNGGQS